MALRDLTPWRAATPARREESWPFGAFRDFDRMFDEVFNGFGAAAPWWRGSPAQAGMLTPRLDVAETDKGYEIAVELPGIDEKDVEVTLAEGVLTIKGEKKAEKEEKNGGRIHVERSFGSFCRSLSLPDDADPEKTDARFDKGVLTVTVEKRADVKPAARRIEVKAKR
jgi:HSP20 family protein